MANVYPSIPSGSHTLIPATKAATHGDETSNNNEAKIAGSNKVVNPTAPNSSLRHMRVIADQISGHLHHEHRPEFAPLVNWKGAEGSPISRWFRYREAYSPELITRLELGRHVLDPFCGCGSIMLGCAQTGRMSVGIDINPLAIFASQVKLTRLANYQIANAKNFLQALHHRLAASHKRWELPSLQISNKVFEPEILDTLLRLRTGIAETAGEDNQLHDFLLLAWIAILERVGSYFKEGNGIKYRNKKRLKSGYTTRAEGTWQLERFGSDQTAFVLSHFSDQLRRMIDDTAAWEVGSWGAQRVRQGDCLQMDDLLDDEQFDTIIFSPPYANRFDYFEAMKVELWFGGFVRSYDELAILRKRSLRSHLGADLSRPTVHIQPLEELIALMHRDASSWRMRVPSALRGYFDDMYQVLLHCRKRLRSGKCYIVVGNSAFAGVIIPTDSLIAMLGLEAGFSSARIMTVRHLTVAPQQRSMLQGAEDLMRESIVVLE